VFGTNLPPAPGPPCPEASWAARAVLSLASCAGLVFGTKVPPGLVVWVVVVAGEPVAALPMEELSRAPPNAPPAIDPTSTVLRIHLLPIVITHSLFDLGSVARPAWGGL
jgi:hypothetical protein